MSTDAKPRPKKYTIEFEVEVYALDQKDAVAQAAAHVVVTAAHLSRFPAEVLEPPTGAIHGAPHVKGFDGWRCVFSIAEAE